MSGEGGSEGRAIREEQAFNQAIWDQQAADKLARQQAADKRLARGEQRDSALRDALKQRLKDERQSDRAEMRTAAADYRAQAKDKKQAAKQLLRSKPKVDVPQIGSLDKLTRVTGVDVNPDLQGLNAASGAYYIAPDSTQSQFAIGAPVGGGHIGVRQRPSTPNLTSPPGNLNSDRKGRF